MNTSSIVQKLWNYCNVLRDDLSVCGHAQAGAQASNQKSLPAPGGAQINPVPEIDWP